MKGSDFLGRFNLLEEPWITVILDDSGATKDVTLKDFYTNAHLYRDLGGDTKTQDFALLRILLSVLHTVFSRVDADGRGYGYVELDERLIPMGEISSKFVGKYEQKLLETWDELWKRKSFPPIICEYLEMWRDRFYLFDDKYPFFQILKEDLLKSTIKKEDGGVVLGKNINRLISESGNKQAIFSPRYEADSNKELLNESEIVKWIIALQSYTGLSDKAKFTTNKEYKPSKGWLYDLGGIFFKGKNLFETLMLNFYITQNEYGNLSKQQKPCWELSSTGNVDKHLDNNGIDNITSLYTAWSRGLYITPDVDLSKAFSLQMVKLSELEHKDMFLEPMTIWKYNEKGDNANTFTPKKHQVNKSMWRTFGLITLSHRDINAENNMGIQRRPGIVDWFSKVVERHGNIEISLVAVSMQDDGNATSWVPVDEIVDELNINSFILTDLQEEGWVIRINNAIELTKNIIDTTYRKYINDIKDIRNIDSNLFINRNVEELYFEIDKPFRTWLESIEKFDDKDTKILEWKKILKKIAESKARELMFYGSARDYIGISDEKRFKNIATAYNSFSKSLYKKIDIKEEKNGTGV